MKTIVGALLFVFGAIRLVPGLFLTVAFVFVNFGFRDGNPLPLEILVLGLTGLGVGLLAVFAGLRLTAVPTQSPN